jgi:hypothetical protein
MQIGISVQRKEEEIGRTGGKPVGELESPHLVVGEEGGCGSGVDHLVCSAFSSPPSLATIYAASGSAERTKVSLS